MKYFLLAILNFSVCICLAQKNFQKGHVVTNDGEITTGYINFRELKKNPASIEFKKNSGDKELHTYTVSDLRSFEITGFEVYGRYSCRISMNATNQG